MRMWKCLVNTVQFHPCGLYYLFWLILSLYKSEAHSFKIWSTLTLLNYVSHLALCSYTSCYYLFHLFVGLLTRLSALCPIDITVTPKTLSILTSTVVRAAHHQTPWESCFALVELKIEYTLGYKIAPWVMWFGSHAAEIWSNQNNNTMERVFSLLNCWHGSQSNNRIVAIVCQHKQRYTYKQYIWV